MNGKKAKKLRAQIAASEGNVSKAAYRRLKRLLRNNESVSDDEVLIEEFYAAKTKLIQLSKIAEKMPSSQDDKLES